MGATAISLLLAVWAGAEQIQIPLHEESVRFDPCAKEEVGLSLDGMMEVVSLRDGDHFHLSLRFLDRGHAVSMATGAEFAARHEEWRLDVWLPGQGLVVNWPVELKFLGRSGVPERAYRERIRVAVETDGRLSVGRAEGGAWACP